MPATEARRTPGETREMRLFSKVIELHRGRKDHSLPQFIARRRQPGVMWRTWDELRYELRDVTGEIASDATIRRWARAYGIPEYTQADGEGQTSTEEYATALQEAGITL